MATGPVPRAGHVGLLGVFLRRGAAGVVRLFDAAGGMLRIDPAHCAEARDRDAVRVEVLPGASQRKPAEGRVVEVLGSVDDPGIDVRIVIRQHGFAEKFPSRVLDEVEALPGVPSAREMARRERFDDPAPVTIDGETARDFDDAIAVRDLPGGGWRLFVHVADVGHFVEPESALDVEAKARGTSVYFPGRVVPMFPERLSADLCSLRPAVDRLVQSVILDLGPDGLTSRVRFADGVIRSAARLTYRQVAAALEGQAEHDLPPHVLPMLRSANRLRARLARLRLKRGSLDFDLPEPEILLDVDGAVTGITVEPRSPAHRMIEEFMLAANEAVAGELGRRHKACLWRVHEPPELAKLQALELVVADGRTGAGAAPTDWTDPRSIRRFIDSFEGRPESRIVSQLVLRAMKQARYSAVSGVHFGLAAPLYCHFTSPIRRYPDLVVHRQLRAMRRGAGAPETEDVEGLQAVANAASILERDAEAAEREVLAWKKAAFIERHVGQTFQALITGVAEFGLFVQIVDNLVEGLLPAARLGDERFVVGTPGVDLLGVRSGTRFRLGDKIEVLVERIDRMQRRVYFALGAGRGPARGPGSPATRAAKPAARRSRAPRRR